MSSSNLLSLRARDGQARDRAKLYLDARDRVAAPFLKKYSGRLPRGVARKIHQQTLRALNLPV